MTAHRPEPTTLTGTFLRLEPLTEEHWPGLFEAIAHASVFQHGFGGGLAALPDSLPSFQKWASDHFSLDNIPFAVIVVGGPHDGVIVGTTTLGDFDEHREATHIGWTAYDPRVWGTVVNSEAKLLLLQHAFDFGFGRVRIQTDVVNQRSRAAILRLGATFEGVVRRDQPRADGTWRDTALYSIVVEEWPVVRDALEKRLAQSAGRPVLFRSPPG